MAAEYRIPLTPTKSAPHYIETGKTHWWVKCETQSIKRITEFADDLVMVHLLRALGHIPHLLLPLKLSAPQEPDKYCVKKPPGTGGGWFSAAELDGLQSLQEHGGITVQELWRCAAQLCQTLSQLLSLGIWGHADRSTILLRKRNGVLEYCLADIIKYNMYNYPQTFSILRSDSEDPKTKVLRLLIGSFVLCLDEPSLREAETASSGKITLEENLGSECTKKFAGLFHEKSNLPPEKFLEQAKEALQVSADHLQLEAPKKLHLYLSVLGSDCRSPAVPALSSAARCFYYWMEMLDAGKDVDGQITCLLPWDTVHICDLFNNHIPCLSALPTNEDQGRYVPLGGLLDCLIRELERDRAMGAASLVCFITLPVPENSPKLSAMDNCFISQLAVMKKMGIFEALMCSADLRQTPDYRYQNGANGGAFGEEAADLKDVSQKIHAAIGRLLKTKRYVMRQKQDSIV